MDPRNSQAHMRSQERAPCGELRPFVRLIWVRNMDQPAAFGPPERIGPDGLGELVFNLGNPMSCRSDGEAFVRQSRSAAVPSLAQQEPSTHDERRLSKFDA